MSADLFRGWACLDFPEVFLASSPVSRLGGFSTIHPTDQRFQVSASWRNFSANTRVQGRLRTFGHWLSTGTRPFREECQQGPTWQMQSGGPRLGTRFNFEFMFRLSQGVPARAALFQFAEANLYATNPKGINFLVDWCFRQLSLFLSYICRSN